MPDMTSRVLAFCFAAPLLFTACQTTQFGSYYSPSQRAVVAAGIASEPPGNYFIGRRYYKQDYKFWGWVRSPGQPWSTAKLVMLNEQEMLAPDRAQNNFGVDNNYEYKLIGGFTGQTVYEPASNDFYPEFKLKKAELLSLTPPNVYHSPAALDPARRVIVHPE
jgi:hypothetical protein